MTTVTTAGSNIGVVLGTNMTTFLTVTDELSSYFSNAVHTYDVFAASPTFIFQTHTDTSITGYDPINSGYVSLTGTGFSGSSGVVTAGTFTAGSFSDPTFTPDGSGSFSFTTTAAGVGWTSSGFSTTANFSTLSVTVGADTLSMTGAIGIDSQGNITGTVTQETFHTLGLDVTLNGSFDAADQIGNVSSIVLSDGAGDTLTLAAATNTFFDAAHFFNGHTTVADIMTDPYFFGAGDIFNIGSNGSWTGEDGVDVMNGGANADNLSGANGNDTLNGNDGNDTLSGDAGNDVLTGGAGNDTLDGGTGSDTLTGGAGDDNYFIDVATDKVIEAAAGGHDTVTSHISYTLAANVEDLILDPAGGAINGTGNGLNNVITGNSAANVLDGGTGTDSLVGGDGNDTYVIRDASDTVTEASNNGTDTAVIAYSNASLVTADTVNLSDYANVENLTVTGTGLFNVNGTSDNNVLIGNASANTLTGHGGNDTFDGGAGADDMNGGSGDDTYTVDNIGDTITDTSGTDTVIDKMTSGTYTLAAGLENLTLSGTASIGGIGNTSANVITGNSGANTLDDGGAGSADSLIGGAGNDTYVVNNSVDTITENAAQGTDLIRSSVSFNMQAHAANVENITLTGGGSVDATGNSLANIITGNSGDNSLYGGGGIDKLAGGAGNDTYTVDLVVSSGVAKMQDTVTDTSGNDTLDLRSDTTLVLTTTMSVTLASTLENLDISATGGTHINITGNASANTMIGNDWDNTISGGAGADNMNGGNGNDTYIVDNHGDVVNDTGVTNSGGDTVIVTYAAAPLGTVLNVTDFGGIENLKVTGTGLFDLNGDANANTLTGNASVNHLAGGDGNDTYIVGAGDIITGETLTGGTDKVVASVNWTLGSNLENLTLSGSAISGTGNADNNVITGNASANTLIGNDGNDTLDGGAGADKLTGGAGADIFVFHIAQALSSTNADTISDFQAGGGGDVINIHDVLQGYNGTDPLAAWVHLTASGANTVVSVDANGATGGAHFVTICTLTGVSLATLIDADTMHASGNLVV